MKKKPIRLEKKQEKKPIISQYTLIKIQLILIIILIVCLFITICIIIGRGEQVTNWYNYQLWLKIENKAYITLKIGL